MHYAAGATYSDTILEVLANEKADVNVKCREGRTPLHIAAVHGRCSRARVLLNHGKCEYICEVLLVIYDIMEKAVNYLMDSTRVWGQ